MSPAKVMAGLLVCALPELGLAQERFLLCHGTSMGKSSGQVWMFDAASPKMSLLSTFYASDPDKNSLKKKVIEGLHAEPRTTPCDGDWHQDISCEITDAQIKRVTRSLQNDGSYRKETLTINRLTGVFRWGGITRQCELTEDPKPTQKLF